MDKEEIKREFVTRIESTFSKNIANGKSKLENLSQNSQNAHEMLQQATPILNSILKEKGINLEGKEMEEFIKFISPTISELARKYILGR